MWDGYTVAMRRARLDGLHAAAIAAAVSFLLYLPVRAMMAGATLFKAPWFDVALQAGRRARSLDCDRRAIALWPHGRHSRCDQWRCLRGLDPSNDCGFGYSDTERMAFYDRLDRDHVDLARRLSGKRRAAPGSADTTAPRRIISIALASPIILAKHWVLPRPRKMPIAISGRPLAVPDSRRYAGRPRAIARSLSRHVSSVTSVVKKTQIWSRPAIWTLVMAPKADIAQRT